MSTNCPTGCVPEIPKVNGFPIQNFRYFNQPIEQVPGWVPGKSQILVHPNDGGLMWKSVECIKVITCIKLEPTGLLIECADIMAVSIRPPELCQHIGVTGCPPSGS